MPQSDRRGCLPRPGHHQSAREFCDSFVEVIVAQVGCSVFSLTLLFALTFLARWTPTGPHQILSQHALPCPQCPHSGQHPLTVLGTGPWALSSGRPSCSSGIVWSWSGSNLQHPLC